MKTKFVMAVVILLGAVSINAQDKFYTKSGSIIFSSKAPVEKIEGHNKNVTCVLDTKTGNMQFAMLMKGFEFDKALMQEHFNENYVESHKFPKAEFKGQVINNSEIDYSKEGSYPATVKGKLTIHGETKEVETSGVIEIKAGKINTEADFSIELSDYKIEIPNVVKDNISKSVRITVDCTLDPLKG